MKCEVFQIELVKSYNANSFKDDMMKIMKRSGVEGLLFNNKLTLFERCSGFICFH